MKKALLMFLILTGSAAYSQDSATVVKPWKSGVKTTILFSQSSLTNWAAGGENSLSTNAYLDFFANYNRGKNQWENSLSLAYGLVKQGDQEFRKNDDKIDLTSKYGYKASEKWLYTVLGNFKTQFNEGYNYPNDSVYISDLFAPAYLTFSLGMDYKPNKSFSVFLSPITTKLTFVTDERLSDEGAFGVDPGETMRTELGGYIKAAYAAKLVDNVDLATQLGLFGNYLDEIQNIDVDWQLMLLMKINKYLTANLNLNLIYDDNVMIEYEPGKKGPRTQFKEVLGVGFTHTF